MPKLPKSTTLKVYLPSTNKEGVAEADKGWVEYKTSISIGDMLAYDPNISEVENTLRILSGIVVDWNFTAEDGSKEPINPTTLASLPLEDFGALAKVVESIVPADFSVPTAEKKS